MAECAGHIIHAVTGVKPAVQHGNFCLALRYECPVEVNDRLFHRSIFLSLVLEKQLNYDCAVHSDAPPVIHWAKKIWRNSLLKFFASCSVGLSMGIMFGVTFSAPWMGG